MANQGNGGGGIWIVVGIAFLLTLLSSLLGTSNTATTPSPVDQNSFEHRYAKERFRLEGYSDRESQQAADAVVRFHNAQKNRAK